LSFFPTASATIFPINNIGIVAASTLVSVLLFKEKLNTKNIIGLTLSLIAIALISIQF
jgi:multidrug transporter EmrE-like cation transporter